MSNVTQAMAEEHTCSVVKVLFSSLPHPLNEKKVM